MFIRFKLLRVFMLQTAHSSALRSGRPLRAGLSRFAAPSYISPSAIPLNSIMYFVGQAVVQQNKRIGYANSPSHDIAPAKRGRASMRFFSPDLMLIPVQSRVIRPWYPAVRRRMSQTYGVYGRQAKCPQHQYFQTFSLRLLTAYIFQHAASNATA